MEGGILLSSYLSCCLSKCSCLQGCPSWLSLCVLIFLKTPFLKKDKERKRMGKKRQENGGLSSSRFPGSYMRSRVYVVSVYVT